MSYDDYVKSEVWNKIVDVTFFSFGFNLMKYNTLNN